ncbi:flagellar hook protein FlgE [Legionella steigerwaltii]|uniref:Flagellar hook protein FlgE n=1 Tax=Legionella steigerwaltii TaxID=460 RepID=A0A378L9P6_9GAMM|nr:flagellar hook-basal body complex protein [Legionella steigerwaltii]KTD77010.1 flagellar hook protein FlgE [Legionella steigerwaltii]STY22439.1 flagellar hook protein FlgE [Legionella steigerwaltii]
MTLKSVLIATVLIISSSVHAANLFQLTHKSLTINQCPVTATGNTFDLALLNSGYFVVSSGKKDNELLFTRFGKLFLDADNYLRTEWGDYLLGMTKKSDPKHLSKIKIPTKNLAPKATSKIKIGANLPASTIEGDDYIASIMVFDSLSKTHELTIKLTRIEVGLWKARVFVGKVALDEGTLQFNTSGTLIKQQGLRHVQWPTDYGIQELKIDFKESTQYAIPFSVFFMNQDGYGVGLFEAVMVTINGELDLLYSNGQSKLLKNHIAVALFTNPSYLENIINHLYRPTEKSGLPRFHWRNSEHAVLSGYLEEEPCLTN